MIRLEGKINVIEYKNMIKESFLTHIFLEEADADADMQTNATEILAKNPEGDMDAMRALVKQTEASLRYNHGCTKTAIQGD